MFCFTKELGSWGYHLLHYTDQCLIAPFPTGTMETLRDCKDVTRRIDYLLKRIGIRRQEGKGELRGTQRLEHLV